jgi:Dolichyl-phosphate-mannose-protein mannosyltransferase
LLLEIKSFFSSKLNLLAFATLVPIGIWIYSRIWMVNPAILGDEYLYSMNARKAAPWDPSPAGDFSNYLFNFVYQGTSLCGEQFYTCGKIFNLFFFLGFIFTLFIVAIRFLPFAAAYGFMVVAGLSPLSVYTSMFLPESMYMFFIGLLLIAVLHAIRDFSWQSWAIAGAAIGAASLVKPHAWLSAIAVGITLLIVGLGSREVGIKKSLFGVAGLVAGAVLTRVLMGLLVAGPKALGFFGQYLGVSTIEQVVTGPAPADSESVVGTTPMSGVVQLFFPQLQVHLLVASAMLAISIVGLLVGLVEILKSRKLTPVTGFVLFAFVWLFSLMVEIVIFTGWVTGGGDDHTTRVLLRYYEFLFVIVPLAGLAVWTKGLGGKANVFLRWSLFILFSLLLTPAFTGFFASLTIQIADAPTLAGLVVNADVFNAAAVIGIIALLVFATFPKYTAWAYLALLPVTMVGTGWQIQDQYQGFRGTLSSGDKAGQYLRDNFKDSDIDDTWILATSRFDATNIAIWADRPAMSYELFGPGSQVSTEIVPPDKRFVIANGDLTLTPDDYEQVSGDGFTLYILKN